MKKKVVWFVLLALVPMFSWGHLKSHVGMGFAYYFYSACYFGLGWSRHWTGLISWQHHLVALVPLAYLSGFLLIDSPGVYFPIYTPLLFLAGLFGYLAGWHFGARRVQSLAVMFVLAGLIGTWRHFLPQVIHERDEKWHQENAYPAFVGKQLEVRLEDEAGTQLGPEAFRGKVVVLDFWFSGCGYCIDKFKWLNQVKEHFAGDDRVLVASVADGSYDPRAKFAQVLAEYPGITKPALYDPGGQLMDKYGIKGRGYSFEVRLDQTSTIFKVEIGRVPDLMAEYYVEQLIAQIEAKLGAMPK
jgi:thiol-disulfide isomerase/thioredoxin